MNLKIDGFDPCEELLPTIVDHHAAAFGDRVYAEFPKSPATYDEGFQKITYGDLANAINGIAWFLVNTLGPGDGTEKLPYVGPNDLRYTALAIGALKAGYCMFFTSPRNSIVAHASLFDKLRCRRLLTSTPRPSTVTTILDAIKLEAVEVPSLEELLEKDYPPFAFTKTLAECESDVFLVIHTSGSTGIPKPMLFTHKTVSTAMRQRQMIPPEGFDSLDHMIRGKRYFMTFPPFHAACLVGTFCTAIPFGTVVIAPTSGTIPSARGMVEGLKQTTMDGGLLIPSIIQELAEEPELLDFCAKNMEYMIYCGGDLPDEVGDKVAAKIKLLNLYGATEMGLLPMIFSQVNRGPEDWKYVEIHPDIGAEFYYVTDNEYELVIVRNPKLEKYQVSFTYSNFAELSKYESNDLFTQHPDPEKKHLWRWHARKDDIIVFLNGEKTNPISMEQHIIWRNPQVTGALVIGAQRFQAALLIEAATDENTRSPSERAALLESIWFSIQEANQECPAHARIAKSHVLFTHPSKPMLRAGKGTVQRPGTLKLYEKEIDALYAEAESIHMQPNEDAPQGPGRDADRSAVYKFIKFTILSITEWTELDDKENMFVRGMDSLQTITAIRILRHGLESSAIDVPLVYSYPSISQLTDAIIDLRTMAPVSLKLNTANKLEERRKLLKSFQPMIDQIPKPTHSFISAEKHRVILTGSTGALGTYLLHDLLANPTVEHVYCLNRRKDGHSAQIESNKARQLEMEIDTSRVTFLKVDLTNDNFSLPSETYQSLQETTTVVIHNAWPVNFNLSVTSFEPQLYGVVNLISFCASALTKPRLFFISSISSVVAHSTESGINPEQVIITQNPAPSGYAESKYLTEILLDHAAKRLQIPLSFARVGQIAGPVKGPGLWNPAEWFPSLITSSICIGAIPDSLGAAMGRIDWVPMDLLSEVLVELALQSPEGSEIGSVEVFHPVNIHPQSWHDLLPTVLEQIAVATSKALDVIPMREWVILVRQAMESKGRDNLTGSKDLETLLKANPAAKLLGFYEHLDGQGTMQVESSGAQTCVPNVLDTTRTAAKSDALCAVPAVKGDWVARWIRGWIAE